MEPEGSGIFFGGLSATLGETIDATVHNPRLRLSQIINEYAESKLPAPKYAPTQGVIAFDTAEDERVVAVKHIPDVNNGGRGRCYGLSIATGRVLKSARSAR